MALYIQNLNNGDADEKGHLRLLGTLLTQSGVIQPTALTVSAQAVPDRSVKVAGAAAGHDIVFKNTDGALYHGWNTADYTVNIAANSSGVTKKDAIVAYADLGSGTHQINNPGSLKIISVRGSGTNTMPDNTQIRASAVGATNPYVILDEVTVPNGASSINSGNLAGLRPFAQVRKESLEKIGSGQVLNDSLSEQVLGVKSSFSTGEVNTGTKWIDGKDIYKKTIDIGNLPNNTTKNVAHGISNLQNVINIQGWATATTYHINIPVAGVTVGRNGSNVYIITTSSDWVSWTGYVTLYYTKSS